MPTESLATYNAERLALLASAIALAVALGGCRGSDWNLGGSGDVGGVAGGAAEFEHPLLAPLLELANVTLVAGIEDAEVNQDDPTLSLDGLELYFCAKRDGGLGREDIWVARRDDAGEDFGAPELVETVSSSARETAAALSPDGLTLWFASDRADEASGDMDVWSATRASRSDPFEAPTELSQLSGPTDDLPRSPSSAYPFLPLVVESPETSYDIFVVPWDGSAYGSARAVTGIDTEHSESDPAFSPDGLLLVFASDRDETNGDLYVATRPDATAPFGAPQPLSALNTDAEESDPWLAPDGSYLLFTSRRDGQRAIYRATAP